MGEGTTQIHGMAQAFTMESITQITRPIILGEAVITTVVLTTTVIDTMAVTVAIMAAVITVEDTKKIKRIERSSYFTLDRIEIASTHSLKT